MNKITREDRLHLWKLCHAADMPRHQILPLIVALGLPVEYDRNDTDNYTSRAAFGAFLRKAADQ